MKKLLAFAGLGCLLLLGGCATEAAQSEAGIDYVPSKKNTIPVKLHIVKEEPKGCRYLSDFIISSDEKTVYDTIRTEAARIKADYFVIDIVSPDTPSWFHILGRYFVCQR